MYNFPIEQAAPLVNALLQTLLLLFCPLVIAAVLGGLLGIWLFFRRHPLLARSVKSRSASEKVLTHLRSMVYLGLLPILLVLIRHIPGMADGVAVMLLLALGATVYLAAHVYGAFCMLDASILEMALASGLNNQAMIRRVLFPLGKNKLIHALCETALFLLAMGAVAGCVAGGGLTGLAVWGVLPDADGLTWLWCLLLLAPLFLLISLLSSRFTDKA